MKGSIRQRSRDSWQLVVDIGTGPGGKRQRHFETVRGKKGDARRRLTELLSGLDKGIPLPPGRLTVADHLKQWLDGSIRSNCSVRTLDSYQSIVERHLIPELGHIQLKQLQPSMIQAYYGKACGQLSAITVRHHHRVLFQSLKYAVKQGYLGRNPVDLTDPPSPRKKTMRTLTQAEVDTLLEAASGNYYYPVIYTAISSGLRQAELLGLRWRDVDLLYMSLSVSQVLYKRKGICEFKEPKTSGSRRRISLTSKLTAFLREYQSQRKVLYEKLGKRITLDDLVFADVNGVPIDPSGLSHAFKKMAIKAGLEDVRFHDLRHTFASLMLLAGAKPKVISEALGHASVAFTMDTYSHIISGMQEDAMALLDKVLPAGRVSGNYVAKLSPDIDIKSGNG